MDRVVITGLGIVSAIGVGKQEFWKNALNGTCGTSEVTSHDTSGFENHRGGEIKDLDPNPFLSQEDASRLERGSIMAIMAAKMAVEDAVLDLKKENLQRVGISMGTTLGEVQALEKADRVWLRGGQDKIRASLLQQYPSGNIPANMAKELGVSGLNIMIPNACAAGNFAIGYAFDLIRSFKADLMLAGGADPFSWIPFTGFNRVGAVSHDVVRPFDRDSTGMMVGEGAAVLVLEPLEKALERKARIYAEVMGYGISCDAIHITAPHPESRGLIQAMNFALKWSSLKPEQIDCVIAHGTGTPTNDRAEMLALTQVFGDRAKDLPVTSIKSMLGHSMGAASAIEALTNALAVYHNLIPPTINYRTPLPDFDIDVVANKCREKQITFGMNNALAFGGNNSSLILGTYTKE
ncbi:MAG: beta-ketoacyl-[acyl-carrier-protein] synthase family protein [Desulfobacterales bacterium]|nr:beta-ketoacyl-[acyl-carrier-protein] synthase family protein [Desulfobacterales bacterium]